MRKLSWPNLSVHVSKLLVMAGDKNDVEMADGEIKVSLICIDSTHSLRHVQSPKKSKKDKEEVVIPLEDLSPLARPLAQKKLVKKLHKTVKKGLCPYMLEYHRVRPASASKARSVKRGVKEVVKGIRKGEKGSVCSFYPFQR